MILIIGQSLRKKEIAYYSHAKNIRCLVFYAILALDVKKYSRKLFLKRRKIQEQSKNM